MVEVNLHHGEPRAWHRHSSNGFRVARALRANPGSNSSPTEGSATTAALITSSNIKNQTIESWDIATEGVGTSEIRNQTGADGADGVSGLEVVGTEVTVLAGASDKTVAISCPEGKRAVGGGYHAEGAEGQDLVVHESAPSVGLVKDGDVWNATGWTVRASNPSGSKAQVQAYVTCALAG